jgi:hypothetical protein
MILSGFSGATPFFGWLKSAAGVRKTRYRGAATTGLWTTMTAAAYNLMRIARLTEAPM